MAMAWEESFPPEDIRERVIQEVRNDRAFLSAMSP